MSDTQITEFLIETTERLLEIVKAQNLKLQELGAVFQEDAILDVERDYCRTIKEDPTNVHQR